MPVADMDQKLSTGEELDSERGSSSAPQSRSNSWRYKHRSTIRREKRMSYMTRANSASMPDCSAVGSYNTNTATSSKDCPLCMVRSFKTTSKGIVESGSFSKSLSSNSLLSSGSLNTSHNINSNNNNGSRSASVDRTRASSLGSSDGSEDSPSICVTPSYFRTLVLGMSGVGKSSLVQQFTRSDIHNDEDENRSPENGPIVSVQLDGQESTMEFIDGAELSDLECYRADAFIIVYAVSEPESFTFAVNLVNYLRHDLGTDRTIFLVANKTDLVRQSLVVSHEAIKYASINDCHFIETSTALNVNLDELLLGILCSIKRQLIPVQDLKGQENMHRLKRSSSVRNSRSSNRALSAISNFIKYACRREEKRRGVTSIKQLM